MMQNTKSGFVTIFGVPNVGKSTLLNALIGQKIAIVSNKPQTTRNNILGILTKDNTQIVFTDTPGIHKPKTKLGEFMAKKVDEASDGVDLSILVVEPSTYIENAELSIMEEKRTSGEKLVLVINKIDTVKKEELYKIVEKYSSHFDFEAIVPISALRKNNVEELIRVIEENMPEGPFYYPEDMITDQPERQIAAEIIREKTLWCLNQEVPHGIAVEIEKMTEKESGVCEIYAAIYCEKASHKGIVIGKNGVMLKKIGTSARESIEKNLDKKVFLKLWVKVKEDWRNSDFLIKNFGYER